MKKRFLCKIGKHKWRGEDLVLAGDLNEVLQKHRIKQRVIVTYCTVCPKLVIHTDRKNRQSMAILTEREGEIKRQPSKKRNRKGSRQKA